MSAPAGAARGAVGLVAAIGLSACGLLLDLDPDDEGARPDATGLDAGPERDDAGSDAGPERDDAGSDAGPERDDAGSDAGEPDPCGDEASVDCAPTACTTDDRCLDECDGLDDDGDGRIDEHSTDPDIGSNCTWPGYPGALEDDSMRCHGKLRCDGCSARPPICEVPGDGLDDDCDGAIDETEDAACGGPLEPVVVAYEFELPPVDVQLDLETTGAMHTVVTGVAAGAGPSVGPTRAAFGPDTAFGISTFQDLPFSPFGPEAFVPFEVVLPVTLDDDAVLAALSGLTATVGSSDGREAGWPALSEIAAGAGFAWSTAEGVTGAVAPAVCAGELGTRGAACFREGSLPVILHVTGFESHDLNTYRASSTATLSGVVDEAETIRRLSAVAARVIGVWSNNAFMDSLGPRRPRRMASRTRAVVEACAWDELGGGRPILCGADQCCTGLGGAGVAPDGDECPLSFTVDPATPLLGTTGSAFELLAAHLPARIALRLADVPAGASPDPRCLVDTVRVRPASLATASACAFTPEVGASLDPALGRSTQHVDRASPGTRMQFAVSLTNVDAFDVDGDGRTDDACAAPGLYPIDFEIVMDDVLVLDTITVWVVIEAA